MEKTADGRIKVLYVISGLSHGGAERMFTRVINSSADSTEAAILMFDTIKKLDVRCDIYRGALREGHGELGMIQAVVQRSVNIIQLVRALRPQVIIASQSIINISLLGFLVMGNFRMARRSIMRMAYDPLESISYWDTVGYKALALSEMILGLLFSRVGYILFSSARTKLKFDKLPIANPTHTVAIRNFCDVDEIREQAKEPVDGWPAIPTLVTVGRIDSQKNHQLLIRAFAEVRKSTPCKLAVIGSGELLGTMVMLAKELGVSEDVLFLGEQSNPFKFVARSRAFILTSNFEGMPNALIEAMAVGVPVITTDCEGCKEILEASRPFGIVVPKNEVHALADAITSVVTNHVLFSELSERARSRSLDFDKDLGASLYVSLFRRIEEDSR